MEGPKIFKQRLCEQYLSDDSLIRYANKLKTQSQNLSLKSHMINFPSSYNQVGHFLPGFREDKFIYTPDFKICDWCSVRAWVGYIGKLRYVL